MLTIDHSLNTEQSTVFYDPEGYHKKNIIEDLTHILPQTPYIIGLDSTLELHPFRSLLKQIHDLCPLTPLKDICNIAHKLDVTEKMLLHKPKYMCPGNMQLGVLFRAVILSPKYVIIDEPLNHLNPDVYPVAHQCIKQLMQQQSTIFVITKKNDFDYLHKTQLSISKPQKITVSQQYPSANVLSIHSLHLKRQRLLFKNASLYIPKYYTVGLYGPNGCGKSSLIDAICQIYPYCGKIQLGDQEVHTIQNLTHQLSVMHQCPVSSFNPQTPLHQSLTNIKQLRKLLSNYSIEQRFLMMYPHQVPYSILKSILLLSTCAQQSSLTIFDEPTSGLNQKLLHHLQHYLADNTTNLIISHDQDFLKQNCQMIWCIDQHQFKVTHA